MPSSDSYATTSSTHTARPLQRATRAVSAPWQEANPHSERADAICFVAERCEGDRGESQSPPRGGLSRTTWYSYDHSRSASALYACALEENNSAATLVAGVGAPSANNSDFFASRSRCRSMPCAMPNAEKLRNLEFLETPCQS
eukprot:3248764-Pyramimonas_sp.AAC.1